MLFRPPLAEIAPVTDEDGVYKLPAIPPGKKYGTGVDLVAFKPDALVLSATLTERDIDVGEVVALNKTEDGTGLALPEGIVTLEFQYQ